MKAGGPQSTYFAPVALESPVALPGLWLTRLLHSGVVDRLAYMMVRQSRPEGQEQMSSCHPMEIKVWDITERIRLLSPTVSTLQCMPSPRLFVGHTQPQGGHC
jgi:hypothetical protein